MMMPAVADLNEDGVSDIVFVTFSGGGYRSNNGVLRAVSGDGSGELFAVNNPILWGASAVVLGDIDIDGHLEIIATDGPGNRLVAFENDGTFKWRSEIIPGDIGNGSSSLADLDHDGVPEIIIGSTVLNNDGTTRWTGSDSQGASGGGFLSVAADLDMTGNLEVVAGNTAYRSDGSVYWTNASVSDGFTALGNFDDDAY